MAEKIGQILIRKGKITPAQLKEALRTQQFFGGFLGSHLINLGFLDEATLGETLSEIYRVPYAPFDSIRLASHEAIAAIPGSLAQRFRVIPLQIEKDGLHLAMLNPRDAVAINEVSAACGLTIVPWVASEYRIVQALEKHYRVKREGRAAIAVSPVRDSPDASRPQEDADRAAASPDSRSTATAQEVGLDGLPIDAEFAPESPAPPAGAPGSIPRTLGEWMEMTDLPEDQGFDRTPASRPSTSGRAPGTGRSVRGAGAPQAAAGAIRRRTLAAGTAARTAMGGAPAPPAGPLPSGLEPFQAALTNVGSKDELGREMVSFLAGQFRRAAAFIVRQDQILGWLGSGPGIDPVRLAGISLEARAPSLFLPVLSAPSVYVGPVPPIPEARELLDALGGPHPPAILLIPILVRDRLVAILYADNQTEPLGPVDYLLWKRFAHMAATSLEILILRNRILKG